MGNRGRRIFGGKGEADDFWPSFTDMLTTILLVMLLILITAVQVEKDNFAEAKAEAEIQKEAAENERKESEKYKETINNILGVKQSIIEDLQQSFGESDLEIDIDPKTGAIKFQENLLFETGKSIIAPEFEKQLKEFIPQYFEILFSEYEEEIAEVLIEGHTDDVGSFNYNLELSQERAFSVVQYILSDEFGGFPYKEQVQVKITANGRSYSNPKFKEGSQEIDRDESRRVEFKFRLFTEKEFEEMRELVESES